MKEKISPRARRRSAETPGLKEKISKYAASAETLAKILSILTACFTLYIVASLYTSWTGSAGSAISGALLPTVGGAVIIPLIFILFVSVSLVFSLETRSFSRLFLGTLCLFLLVSLLLGANKLTGGENVAKYPFAASGALGWSLASSVYETTGVVGVLIIGLLLIYFTLLFFNAPVPPFPKTLGFFGFKSKKERDGEADINGKAETNGETDDAANIKEFRGEDYFGYEEERPEEEKRENADAEASEASEAQTTGFSNVAAGYDAFAGGNGELFDEGIDYNDPESVMNAQADDESTAPAVIQDPSFNYEDTRSGRVRQGIFPPPIELFGPEESRDGEMDEEKARPLGEKIVNSLREFKIESQVAEILVGPTVIQFRIQLAPGIKVSRVASLSNDIALAMAVPSLRIEAPIPGKPYVGIEIPNPKRRGIPFRTVVEDASFQNAKFALPLPFGVAVNGDPVVVGLEELPHLLVAGTTGSGKSVFVNSCIVGLCSKRPPEELRMILVDPKRVEMAVYDKLPHLLTPPVTDPKKAVAALAWLLREMESRYAEFAKARVRNLEGFNEKVQPKDKLPHIVIVVDELADLMMTAAKEVEEYICRLAQMARATGIHLMLATQRPSVNIITGLIKANIPARVAFTLPSIADSRTIIDCAGADKLLGKGDMLFLSTKHPKPVRIQSPWIDEKILDDWLKYMTNTFGEPEFIEIEEQDDEGIKGMGDGDYDDDKLEEAISTVMETGIASASGLQRRLRLGFSRASRLIDMMERLGIIGAPVGSKPREILVGEEEAREILLDARGGD